MPPRMKPSAVVSGLGLRFESVLIVGRVEAQDKMDIVCWLWGWSGTTRPGRFPRLHESRCLRCASASAAPRRSIRTLHACCPASGTRVTGAGGISPFTSITIPLPNISRIFVPNIASSRTRTVLYGNEYVMPGRRNKLILYGSSSRTVD